MTNELPSVNSLRHKQNTASQLIAAIKPLIVEDRAERSRMTTMESSHGNPLKTAGKQSTLEEMQKTKYQLP